MTTLWQHLTALPSRDLRAVATCLGVAKRGQHQKQPWLHAIHNGWHAATTRQQWLAQLSPTAHAALRRLLPVPQLPLPLWLAEYGNVRRVTARQHWAEPPWQSPATVSEELYYCGLLVPGPTSLLHKAVFVTLPTDLRPLLTNSLTLALKGSASLTSDPLTSDPLTSDPLTSDPLTSDPLTLCHDLAQLLIFLHQSQLPHLLHNRWLTPAHCQQLNERLRQPQPVPLPPSHKQADRLVWLFFLASAADLQRHGQLTPLAWAWLAAPLHQQLQQLWQAWQQAPPDLRTAYQQPAAHLSAPWPHLLVAPLAQATARFTTTDLANALLAQTEDHAWWVAQLPDLAALDQLVAALLAGPLTALGLVVAQTSPGAPQPIAPSPIANIATDPAVDQPYSLTATGAWLLQRPDGPPPATPIIHQPATYPSLQVQAESWQVSLPTIAHLLGQAQLAAYATYQAAESNHPLRTHTYQLTAQTVARAAAAGHGLATLFAAFTHLDIVLTPPQIEQLHRWHAQGQQITLEHLLVLRTQQPAQLAVLYQHPDLRTLLGEPLTPTLCVVPADPATTLTHLRRAGFHPAAVGELVEPTASSPTASSPDAEPVEADATNPPNETTVPPHRGRLGGGAAGGTLWLAGQLYALLGDHLALPSPPPWSALDQIWQEISPAEQAVLQAQRQQLQERLLDLLDALPLTPPPTPSNPEQWRPLLQTASQAQTLLRLTYFSAGRNLLTRRLVQPYWLEEHHTIPYLRAYCHQAGRVLTFRLDRIMAIELAIE